MLCESTLGQDLCIKGANGCTMVLLGKQPFTLSVVTSKDLGLILCNKTKIEGRNCLHNGLPVPLPTPPPLSSLLLFKAIQTASQQLNISNVQTHKITKDGGHKTFFPQKCVSPPPTFEIKIRPLRPSTGLCKVLHHVLLHGATPPSSGRWSPLPIIPPTLSFHPVSASLCSAFGSTRPVP